MAGVKFREDAGARLARAGPFLVRVGAVPPGFPRIRSPLLTWFPDRGALARFRRGRAGRSHEVLAPRDEAWRTIVPGYREAVAMAASGLPFQVVADRRYDRSGDPRRLRAALASGKTVFLPQVHQVLPRLMRLMVALRVELLGPFREECSFLFATEGHGREAMGLHHDGEVDQFWLQLEGRRTVTLAPPLPAGAPQDAPPGRGRGGGWRTLRLAPGSLLYMPPRTPHRVLCHERSLAVSLTWKTLDPRDAVEALLDTGGAPGHREGSRSARACPSPARYAALVRAVLRRAGAAPVRRSAMVRAHALGLTTWDVVSGRAEPIPAETAASLWTQVPVHPVPPDRGRPVLLVEGGAELRLPPLARPLAARLATMPRLTLVGSPPEPVRLLMERGILAPRDLPLRVVPSDPAALDGWRFA